MSKSKDIRRHKWTIDFTGAYRSKSEKQLVPSEHYVAPYGYSDSQVSQGEHASKEPDSAIIVKKSWDIALGPLKQIPMNLFIMWMAGNSISIFPIMMVGMMFFRPIQAFIAIQNTFKMIEGGQAPLQKFVYLLGNLICLGIAVYKCHVMGLLPTTASDWLAFVMPQKRLEWSGGGAML